MKTLQNNWAQAQIKQAQIDKYLDSGKDFINDVQIAEKLKANCAPDRRQVEDILAKSLAIAALSPDETAVLLNVTDPDLWQLMRQTGVNVKKKVYDNRVVTFAPLYMSNFCVNNCAYCGFRKENSQAKRRMLAQDQVKEEIKALAGQIGHKRLIAVFGEHSSSGVDYIVETLNTIYSVKEKTKNGYGSIRRVNVNAAPMSIEDLRLLKKAGLGTYQVFQETYHHPTYGRVHPVDTLKGNYRWRLYCMHRALEAGIDDVGIGVLFGLYDWKFEVMGLVCHAHELENKFGIGPHTISFPRLEPAQGSNLAQNPRHKVSDQDFLKLITVIRLAVPYAGMIITARETAPIRRESFLLGITQTDASTRIGIGAYSGRYDQQEEDRQQFLLGDTRSLDELIAELAGMGFITSFCTAGYRCGRTGSHIMKLLRTGQEGKFCKLNAVLTFREWLDDFASPETKAAGEKLIARELDEIKLQQPEIYPMVIEFYEKIKQGRRDLYF